MKKKYINVIISFILNERMKENVIIVENLYQENKH